MGRKKALNPMEAYRRKQKKSQISRNKKKRAEAKDKALQRRDPEWIMTEIQKLNRREKQDHGKNEEKYSNRRKKLLEAYNRAVRIRNIKQKTQRNTSNESNTNKSKESSPTPPPIECADDLSKHIDDDTSDTHTSAKDDTIATTTTQAVPSTAHPIPIHPNMHPHATNMYNHLYNPLLMNPYILPSIYSDSLGAKSSRNNDKPPTVPPQPVYRQPYNAYANMQHPNPYYRNDLNANAMTQNQNDKSMKARAAKDTFDPMNPRNPKYNFVPSRNEDFQRYIQPVAPQQIQKQPLPQSIDTNKTKKPKRQIEVIMDPKLQSMMPSSLRFKRKFEQPQAVRPTKKRKLDIAPDVDDSDGKNVSKHNVNPINTNNKNVNRNFGSGNADAAYDKFMDEINYLIDANE